MNPATYTRESFSNLVSYGIFSQSFAGFLRSTNIFSQARRQIISGNKKNYHRRSDYDYAYAYKICTPQLITDYAYAYTFCTPVVDDTHLLTIFIIYIILLYI